MLLFYKPILRFIRGHTLRGFLITGRRIIQNVCIFVLCFPVRPFLGLVGEAASPPIVVPDFSILVCIYLLVLIYFYKVYSNTLDIFLVFFLIFF